MHTVGRLLGVLADPSMAVPFWIIQMSAYVRAINITATTKR